MPDSSVVGEVRDGPFAVAVTMSKRRNSWEVTELNVRLATSVSAGITATSLREIRLGYVVEQVLARHAAATVPKAPILPVDSVHRDLTTAQRYLTYVSQGHPTPALAVAQEQSLKNHRTIYNRLLRLRQEGLLTKPGHGRPGGALTPKAKRLLRGWEK